MFKKFNIIIAVYFYMFFLNPTSCLKAETQPQDTTKLKTLIKQGKELRYTKDNLKSIELLKQAEQLATQYNDSKSLVKVYKYFSDSYGHKGDISIAIDYGKKSLDLAQKIKYQKYISLGYTDLAYLYSGIDDHINAIKSLIIVIDMCKKDNDTVNLIVNNLSLAFNYTKLNKWKQAEELLYLSDSISNSVQDKNTYSLLKHYIFDSWGDFFLEQLKNKEALSKFKKALKFTPSLNDSIALADLYYNFGDVYNNLNQLDSAYYFYNSASEIWKNYNQVIQLYDSYLALSDIELRRKNLKRAKFFLNLFEQKSSIEFSNESMKFYHLYKSNYEKEVGNLANCIEHLKLYNTYNDKVLDENTLKTIAKMEAQFELKQIEKEKETLKKDKLILIAKKQKSDKLFQLQRTVIFLLLAILLVLSFAIFYIRKLVKEKEKANLDLFEKKQSIEKQNILIEKQRDERGLLLKEIHHRVKNNLQVVSSLLRLNAKKIKDVEAKQIMEESQLRVQVISLLHQKLYSHDELSTINLREFVEQLGVYIKRTYSSDSVKINTANIPTEFAFDIDTSVPLGLIINELISNSIKHAFENLPNGIIEISLFKISDGLFELNFSDNGNGSADDLTSNSNKTTGVNLVKELSKQLHGELTISQNNGLHFKLVFKDTILRKQRE